MFKNLNRTLIFLAMKSISQKKKRTKMTLISIILSTVVIFSSLILIKNIFQFSKQNIDEDYGSFHYAIVENHGIPKIQNYDMTIDQNTDYYGIYHNQNINLRSLIFTSEKAQPLPYVITNGRFPTNEKEVLVPDTWQLKLGESINLSLYKQNNNTLDDLYPKGFQSSPTQDFVFEVVGVYHQTSFFQKFTNEQTLCYTLMPSTGNMVYYVYDQNVQRSHALNNFSQRVGIDINQIYHHQAVVTKDVICAYLLNPTKILALLLIVATLASFISFHSIHNALLSSDRSRKKEIGLLKSIGTSPKQIEIILKIEMLFLGVVGSLLGIICGYFISYFILNQIIDKIYVRFTFEMIMDPFISVFSFIFSTTLMYQSGMRTYKELLVSLPVMDLYDTPKEKLEPPEHLSSNNGFSWQMFLIYNERLKKHNLNIRMSLILLLMTTTLFSAIYLSNMIFKNHYYLRDYDFDISNTVSRPDDSDLLMPLDEHMIELLYQQSTLKDMNVKDIYTKRYLGVSPISQFYLKPDDNSDDELYALSLPYVFYQNEKYFRLNDNLTVLDSVQIENLKSKIEWGSLDHLSDNDVIYIVNSENYEKYRQIFDQLPEDFNLYYFDVSDENSRITQFHIAACVLTQAQDDTRSFGIADSSANFIAIPFGTAKKHGLDINLLEHTYISLKSTESVPQAIETIDKVMKTTHNTDKYVIENKAIDFETNLFTAFIIEALFYPMFFLLFIVSVMNIYNVFLSNVNEKAFDIAIMQSTGMTTKQLRHMLLFEYLEQYGHAGLYSAVCYLPFISIFNLFFSQTYDLVIHTFATIIISFVLTDLILICPLIYLSIKKISRTSPIETMRKQ